MTIFRRFLVLQMLMLWQGGFLFYATFVVPAGSEVLGGSFEQGKITRLVTNSINWVGAAALIVFAWDLPQLPLTKRKRIVLWSSWLAMAAGLIVLFILHPRLEELVDFEASKHRDRRQFHLLHRSYLWISTAQWFAGLIFALVLLFAWQSGDRRAGRRQPPDERSGADHSSGG